MNNAAIQTPLLNFYDNPSSPQLFDKALERLQEVGGKLLKPNAIRQNVFRVKWSEREVNLRDRSSVQATVSYFKYLKEKVTAGKILTKNFEEDVKVALNDLNPIIVRLIPNFNEPWRTFSSNDQPTFAHFHETQHLFYASQLNQSSSRYNLDLYVIYQLRLSLEKRILGLLGIDLITNARNQPISAWELLKIIPELETLKIRTEVNFIELHWVWNWLNHHIHRHFRPVPWSIHQAFLVINELFRSPAYQTEKRRYCNVYSSTLVEDKKEYLDEIERQIQARFEGAKILWAQNKLEVLTP